MVSSEDRALASRFVVYGETAFASTGAHSRDTFLSRIQASPGPSSKSSNISHPRKDGAGGAGMAQWIEHLPPTNVDRVQIPDRRHNVG